MLSVSKLYDVNKIMCGVSGIIVDGSPIQSLEKIKLMTNTLNHRGPDQFIYYSQKTLD